MRGRGLMLTVAVLASLAVIVAVPGAWVWPTLALLPLGWLVAWRPDSLAPLGWMTWAIGCWTLGGGQSLWAAAVVALALGAVHLGAALTARTAPTGPAWMRGDWYRFAGFLGATVLGLGLVVVATALPAPQGLVWVPAAVFVFAAVVVVLRLGLDRGSA